MLQFKPNLFDMAPESTELSQYKWADWDFHFDHSPSGAGRIHLRGFVSELPEHIVQGLQGTREYTWEGQSFIAQSVRMESDIEHMHTLGRVEAIPVRRGPQTIEIEGTFLRK